MQSHCISGTTLFSKLPESFESDFALFDHSYNEDWNLFSDPVLLPCPTNEASTQLPTPQLDFNDLFHFVRLNSAALATDCMPFSHPQLPAGRQKDPLAAAAPATSTARTLPRFSAIPARLTASASASYLSPYEAPVDCFNYDAFEAAAANFAAQTPMMHSLLQPSPLQKAVNSPFIGSAMAFPELDPAFTNCGPSLFDEFEVPLGDDFPLFESVAPASTPVPAAPAAGPFSNFGISTPVSTMEQIFNTPMMPNGLATPFIPLQQTPFVPSLPSFTDGKVSVDVNDLKVLIAAATGGNINLGSDKTTLALLHQLAVSVPSPAFAPTPVSADKRSAPGGKVRRKPSKVYTCSFEGCSKEFTRAFNLKTHEDTHDKNRPRDFVCSAEGCGKTFVRIHDLSRHALTHDQSKWHVCTACDRGFARIDALRRHQKTGTGVCRPEDGTESP